MAVSLENSVSALYNLLELTHERGTREIQLVAAQEEYVNPSRRFVAERVG
ncbi:Pyridoxamine kinase [Calidithermus terrae]|uniref:Pyridoxamine kinase n=1 Tax=Calidithermus terrae TaxID=1408545 RepID=A0A399EHU8_9DEIN|nr:Pyridoxamine kinase [Calidithermus terrae]